MDLQPVIKIIECPRDAIQGIKVFIPTESKIKYINALLKVGFDTIDAGSFVSPRYVPQMIDTAEVLEAIEWKNHATKLSVIVANERGAIEASQIPGRNLPGRVTEVNHGAYSKRVPNHECRRDRRSWNRATECRIDPGRPLTQSVPSMNRGKITQSAIIDRRPRSEKRRLQNTLRSVQEDETSSMIGGAQVKW